MLRQENPEKSCQPTRARLRRQVEEVVRKTLVAEKQARVAGLVASYDPLGARCMRKDADRLDAEGEDLLNAPVPVERGTGGELTPTGEIGAELPGLVEPVEAPNIIEVEASLTRLELAGGAGSGVLGLALEAAHLSNIGR